MEKVSVPQQPAASEQKQPQIVSDPRIYIGAPAYGGTVHVPWMCSIISALQSCQCVGDVQFFNGDSLVNRARNNLASLFLYGKDSTDQNGNKIRIQFDWLLFLDTDLIFKAEDVASLYALGVKNGPGIYAGTYPLKTIKPKIVFNALPGQVVDANGIIAVREAGTGFMLIHRKVFEKMKAAYPAHDYNCDIGDAGAPETQRHDYFTVGVKNNRFLSEDWYFCQKWSDMGGRILMDTKICAQHIGQFVFPANPAEIIEVAEIFKKAITTKKEYQDRIAAELAKEAAAQTAVASAA